MNEKEMRFRLYGSVEVLLLNEKEEILLIRRSNTGYGDGLYSLPSGHIEAGEGIVAAAIREAREEVGVEIQREDLQHACVMYRPHQPASGADREYVDHFFICRRWQGTPYNAEPDRCSDVAFFPITALPENFIDYVRLGIESSLNGISFVEYTATR